MDTDNIDNTGFSNSIEWKKHTISKKKCKSIMEDMAKLNLSEQIKKRADLIYNKMNTGVNRGSIRKKLTFFCIYCAHLELGLPCDPVKLGKECGLDSNQVQRCQSKFSPLQTGYTPPKTVSSPIHYIGVYASELGLTEQCQNDVVEHFKILCDKKSEISEKNPQTVAAAFLKYYCTVNGIEFDNNNILSEITCRSKGTIDSVFKIVSEIDNNF